jgi:hypothetical protein
MEQFTFVSRGTEVCTFRSDGDLLDGMSTDCSPEHGLAGRAYRGRVKLSPVNPSPLLKDFLRGHHDDQASLAVEVLDLFCNVGGLSFQSEMTLFEKLGVTMLHEATPHDGAQRIWNPCREFQSIEHPCGSAPEVCVCVKRIALNSLSAVDTTL